MAKPKAKAGFAGAHGYAARPCIHPPTQIYEMPNYNWCHECGGLQPIIEGQPGEWVIPFIAQPNDQARIKELEAKLAVPTEAAGFDGAHGSAADVEDGRNLIIEKMRRERSTLREYLRSRATGEAMSSKEWGAEPGGKEQSAYRAGSSNAYLDIERMLERDGFAPEPPNIVIRP